LKVRIELIAAMNGISCGCAQCPPEKVCFVPVSEHDARPVAPAAGYLAEEGRQTGQRAFSLLPTAPPSSTAGIVGIAAGLTLASGYLLEYHDVGRWLGQRGHAVRRPVTLRAQAAVLAGTTG
jgi:hypothetical protein